MREVTLKAGQRIKVLGLSHRNMSTRIEFEVETADGAPPRGVVETSHRSVFTGRKTESHPLHALNALDKPWREHGYQVHVTSETDAMVRFRTRHIRDVHMYGVVAVMAGVGIIASVVLAVLR